MCLSVCVCVCYEKFIVSERKRDGELRKGHVLLEINIPPLSLSLSLSLARSLAHTLSLCVCIYILFGLSV